jgi:hypothetical protein
MWGHLPAYSRGKSPPPAFSQCHACPRQSGVSLDGVLSGASAVGNSRRTPKDGVSVPRQDPAESHAATATPNCS